MTSVVVFDCEDPLPVANELLLEVEGWVWLFPEAGVPGSKELKDTG